MVAIGMLLTENCCPMGAMVMGEITVNWGCWIGVEGLRTVAEAGRCNRGLFGGLGGPMGMRTTFCTVWVFAFWSLAILFCSSSWRSKSGRRLCCSDKFLNTVKITGLFPSTKRGCGGGEYIFSKIEKFSAASAAPTIRMERWEEQTVSVDNFNALRKQKKMEG